MKSLEEKKLPYGFQCQTHKVCAFIASKLNVSVVRGGEGARVEGLEEEVGLVENQEISVHRWRKGKVHLTTMSSFASFLHIIKSFDTRIFSV